MGAREGKFSSRFLRWRVIMKLRRCNRGNGRVRRESYFSLSLLGEMMGCGSCGLSGLHLGKICIRYLYSHHAILFFM